MKSFPATIQKPPISQIIASI